jgi:hypothetical protein
MFAASGVWRWAVVTVGGVSCWAVVAVDGGVVEVGCRRRS